MVLDLAFLELLLLLSCINRQYAVAFRLKSVFKKMILSAYYKINPTTVLTESRQK